MYWYKGNYSKAKQCYLEQLMIAEELGSNHEASRALGNIGEIYIALGNYPKALEFFQKQLNVSKELNAWELISFAHRYIGEIYAKTGNYEQAIGETIRTVGEPLTITSVVLFFGFGVLMLSTFKPIIYFGLLMAITMISALIGDLFVLPALLKVFKPMGPDFNKNNQP